MEYVNCNFCDSSNTTLLFSKKDKFGVSHDAFNVLRCENCGLIYINPRPDKNEIVKFYPDSYSWKELQITTSFFPAIIERLEKLYRYHLLDYEVNKALKITKLKTGKVLDVGCGVGDRLDIFRKKGFELFGVEISSSAKYAREKLKLNVIEGDLWKANFPNEFFDIIVLHNVLEHTHDPRSIIQEIKRVLKRDKFLIIQVPNTDSCQFKLFKKRWSAFDAPRDLYYFNSRLLRKLLEKEGFKIIRIDHFCNWAHPPTIVTSLLPCLDPQFSWLAESRKRTPFLKRLLWIFFTLIASPLPKLESLMGKGALITVFACKQSG